MSFEELVSRLQALQAAESKASAVLDVALVGSARYVAADRRCDRLGDEIVSVTEQLGLHAPDGPLQELVLVLIGLKGLVWDALEDDEAIASMRSVARTLASQAGLNSPEDCGVLVGYWRRACELEQVPAKWKRVKRSHPRPAARASDASFRV